MRLQSFVANEWRTSAGASKPLFHAITGARMYEIDGEAADFSLSSAVEYARQKGGANLRQLTFHQRARILKALGLHLLAEKEKFYEISKITGATRRDSWIDIEGGIGTLFAYASLGRREFPDETFYIDGDLRPLSKEGSFIGRHLCTSLEGVHIQINAFNFPIWGMLEKFAPSFLAGMPSIVKPSSVTAYLAESMVRSIVTSGILPEGSLQLVCGGGRDLLNYVTGQDVVGFTGSLATGIKLKQTPAVLLNNARFNMEADSLNCCLLGNDIIPQDEEFTLFVKEVAREMTVKSGQKCTAIRRIFVPDNLLEPVQSALMQELKKVVIGDPQLEQVRMGALASRGQVQEVLSNVDVLLKECQLVYGHREDFAIVGANKDQGAFLAPMLLACHRPLEKKLPHTVEAFGPISTLMPYRNLSEAITLVKKGEGSLVGSIFTRDQSFARELVLGTASHHGRMLIIDRTCAKESTGHGSPLPYLVHGGPGRAGGGEEMGGVHGVLHFMQRTALQGHPTQLSFIMRQWMPGAQKFTDQIHPFRKYFEDLRIGENLLTARRTVGEADVVNFAGVSGDYFYAHMDEIAAKESLFEKRVAHGYFVLSAAAGLFVEAKVGPVLANYGLERLRFVKPVGIGDTIQVSLTCMKKTRKEKKETDRYAHGVVEWSVEVSNQLQELVASYSILTLVQCREQELI